MNQLERIYLYETLEDYQEAVDSREKDRIFQFFCTCLWNSSNRRLVCQKNIRFKIDSRLLHTEIGQLFYRWSCISYLSCRSVTQEKDSVSLVRQKINNIYTNLFDEGICLTKEYLDLLRLPKTLYFQWLSGKTFDPANLSAQLEEAIRKSEDIKEAYARRKMKLSWPEFQEAAEIYLKKLFDNYIPLDQFENQESLCTDAGAWEEDNYCTRYFCRGLDGYFKVYQKKYYGIYNPGKTNTGYRISRCKKCGALFQQLTVNQKLCRNCAVYHPISSKTITCRDCGKTVFVAAKDNQSCRCRECYSLYRKRYKALKERERRKRETMDSAIRK